MRHGNKVKKLGRTHEHRRALLRNLVRELVTHDRIQTTLAKAKEAQRFADRMVSYARTGTLAARREAARFIGDGAALRRLFGEVGPRFADRSGGYTRIYRLGPRPGDAAEMALLEFVVRPAPAVAKTAARKKPRAGKEPASGKPEPKAKPKKK
ncbi:MAG: 50S ribosomal protein L17 [bacterium]